MAEIGMTVASACSETLMDESRVAEIAIRHRALQVDTQAQHAIGDGPGREAVRQQVDACWQQLADECGVFCDAYNQAFGAGRIYCQRHEDTIVVRSSDDPQETVTFTRTSLSSSQGGHIEAHRYSSHAAPVHLPVEGHVEGHAFTLLREGTPITPADAVLLLLEQFTELLTSARATE